MSLLNAWLDAPAICCVVTRSGSSVMGTTLQFYVYGSTSKRSPSNPKCQLTSYTSDPIAQLNNRDVGPSQGGNPVPRDRMSGMGKVEVGRSFS